MFSEEKKSVERQNNSLNEDIWGEDELTVDGPISIAGIKRVHENQGYVDGITEIKESTLQKAFDDLFPEGASLGMEVGYILAKLYFRGDDQSLLEAKKEMNIREIFKREYYDDDLKLKNGKHELVTKWKLYIEGEEQA